MQTKTKFRCRTSYGDYWTKWRRCTPDEAKERIRWISLGEPWQVEETTLEVSRQVVIHGEVEDDRVSETARGGNGSTSGEPRS